MCRAQDLGSYAQGQGSLAVFKVTARNQGHYKGFRGHLLHTVTFLVLNTFGKCSPFSKSYKYKDICWCSKIDVFLKRCYLLIL